MTEENNNQVPPRPPAPATPPAPPAPPQAQPEQLQAELDRARSRNKALKITLALLATLLVLLGVAGYTVYRRIMQTKEAVEEAFQAFPQQAMFEQMQQAAAASAQRPGVHYSTSMPSSSLGLFSGGLPDSAPAMSEAQAAQIASAINKYAERPIVKEFIADLKKNPDMAKALDLSKGNNPIAMLAAVQNAKGMEPIIAKYAMRPEFMKLVMEMSSDPALQGAMNTLPSGIRPDMGALRQQARPVSSAPAGDHSGPGETDEPELGEGMTLDPAAVSGGTPAPAPAKPAKRVPSPVDTE